MKKYLSPLIILLALAQISNATANGKFRIR